jgi:predicted nucleic acid-binding protein
MLLADTSVWLLHLRSGLPALVERLEAEGIVCHRFVVAELACGPLRRREAILGSLDRLPQLVVAQDREVLRMIETHRLMGCGLGYIDAHLLASVLLAPGTRLWTREREVAAAAARLGIEGGP